MLLEFFIASFITYWAYIHFYKPKPDIVASGKSILITGKIKLLNVNDILLF